MKKEKTKLACVEHKNHRQRLYKTVSEAGLENINDYTALEFILTYVHPRVDTNPIAHNLINKFGNIAAVLDATPEELEKTEGMGPTSSKMLAMMPHIFRRYVQDKQKNNNVLGNREAIVAFCQTVLSGKQNEEFYAISLSKTYKVLRVELLAKGNINKVFINSQEFLRKMISIKNNHFVVITHSHPDNSCQPSREDRIATQKFEDMLSSVGLKLIEHVIVGQHECYCMKEDSVHAN